MYFIVPGFVAIKVFDLLIPTERRDFGAALVEVVSYSLFNWVIFAGLLTVHNAANPGVLDFKSGIARFAYVFITPAFLALLAYYLRSTRPGIVRRVLRFLHIHIVDPMPTAWDEFFSRGESCYLIFHLKSQELVGASFEGRSFATSYPGPQELYVEQLWVIDPATRKFIKPITNTKGAIIKLDDCDLIEMFTAQPVAAGTPPSLVGKP